MLSNKMHFAKPKRTANVSELADASFDEMFESRDLLDNIN